MKEPLPISQQAGDTHTTGMLVVVKSGDRKVSCSHFDRLAYN